MLGTSAVPPPTFQGRPDISVGFTASLSFIEDRVRFGSFCLALHRRAIRLLRPLLTAGIPSLRLSTPLASRQNTGSPGVIRVTFAPCTRRIYAHRIRVTAGFRSIGPLAHAMLASYALRVPRVGALPTASFPRYLAIAQLPFS